MEFFGLWENHSYTSGPTIFRGYFIKVITWNFHIKSHFDNNKYNPISRRVEPKFKVFHSFLQSILQILVQSYFRKWEKHIKFSHWWVFPGGSEGKESACNAGDPGLIPGSGRSLGEGNGYPLQYSCLENPMEESGRPQSMGSHRVVFLRKWPCMANFSFICI